MPAVRPAANAGDMDGSLIPDASANPAVFLVELRAPHAGSQEIRGMHRALHLAVARLAATGVEVRWLSALTIPEQSRSLYFIAAADRGDVVQARDTAGLLNAAIHRVLALPDTASPRPVGPVPPPDPKE